MGNPRAATIAGVAKAAKVSLVGEIATGIVLGIAGGFVWKMYHVNLQRKTEDLYSSLEKGSASLEAKE